MPTLNELYRRIALVRTNQEAIVVAREEREVAKQLLREASDAFSDAVKDKDFTLATKLNKGHQNAIAFLAECQNNVRKARSSRHSEAWITECEAQIAAIRKEHQRARVGATNFGHSPFQALAHMTLAAK